MSKRGKKLQSEIGTFLKQYQRKAHAGWDPNDRGYDRDIEKKIKSMSPEDMSALMTEELKCEVPRDVEGSWFAGETIQGINFHLNDSVSIALGPHAGEGGAVISLLRLTPEHEYLIELGSGQGDIKVFQSRLVKCDT